MSYNDKEIYIGLLHHCFAQPSYTQSQLLAPNREKITLKA